MACVSGNGIILTNQSGLPNCKTIRTKQSLSSIIPSLSSSRRRVSNLRSISNITTNNNKRRQHLAMRAAAENITTTTTENLGVKVQTNPPESKLAQLGVRDWPKWGCPPSKFPWTYSSKETCYLLKGKVKVYPEGSNEAVEIGAGDLVEFPKGMSCTWDVSEAVDKHYNFD